MCRPSPVPPWSRRVVKNGSKARRRTSRLMPTPLSEKRISTLSLPEARTWMSTAPALPSGKACATELRNRLVNIWPYGPQTHHHLLGEIAEIEDALIRIVAVGRDLLERGDQFGGAIEVGHQLGGSVAAGFEIVVQAGTAQIAARDFAGKQGGLALQRGCHRQADADGIVDL